VRESRGPKSDKRDAYALAEQLRIGSLETRVYKGRGKSVYAKRDRERWLNELPVRRVRWPSSCTRSTTRSRR
jgi:hypothetical protein